MHSPLLSQEQPISKILAFAAIRTNSDRGTLSLAVWAGALEVALVENLLDVRMGILMHKKLGKMRNTGLRTQKILEASMTLDWMTRTSSNNSC